MRCQTIGRMPTLTKGLGIVSECSRRRVPSPPQNSTTFILGLLVGRVAPPCPCSTASTRAPVQVVVDLLRSHQILELLEPGERAEFVGVLRKLDALEQAAQFLRALGSRPARLEPR